jgi:dTDP-4-amino-4,6-dideoxygalactose transaminase
MTYFTYSREAILDILKVNHIGEDDEVVLPNYLCSTVIESILPATQKIIFYDIDSHLMHKESEIIKLLTAKTKLIMFVDYFGVETQLESSLQDRLKNKDIIVVKDSAHAFLSVVNRSFHKDYNYDYLITSVYKNLPFQAGSIAIGNFGQRADFVSLYTVLKRFAVLAIKNTICILGLQRFFAKKACEIKISNASKIELSRGFNISGLYKAILFRLDLVKVITERKILTRQFNNFFSDRATFRPIFRREQIEMNVLQDYPLYFKSQTERDRILKLLIDNSIDAYTWPTFHSINSRHKLWNKVLVLPLDNKVLKVLQNV